MKQLHLFELPSPERQEQLPTALVAYWKMSIDGASRNNPGPAGVGICIKKNNEVVNKIALYVGTKTNNQAEYLALLIGLYYLKHQVLGDDPVMIISDSQLLVRQIQGAYKVKHPELKPLHAVALRELGSLNFEIAHVLREENSEADELANLGIDSRKAVPPELVDWLHNYELYI